MESNPPTTDRPVRVSPIVWILGLGLIVALAAILVFHVPLRTVGYFALFALFMGSHFFMHGSHGGHGGHRRRNGTTTNVDGPAGTTQSDQDAHSRHSGGCP